MDHKEMPEERDEKIASKKLDLSLIFLISKYGWEEVLRALSKEMHGDLILIHLRGDIKNALNKMER